MISENLDELLRCLRTAFVLREVQGYSTAKRRRSWASRKTPEGAVVARAAPVGRAAGIAPARNEGRHDRRDGRSRVQLLLRVEVKEV